MPHVSELKNCKQSIVFLNFRSRAVKPQGLKFKPQGLPPVTQERSCTQGAPKTPQDAPKAPTSLCLPSFCISFYISKWPSDKQTKMPRARKCHTYHTLGPSLNDDIRFVLVFTYQNGPRAIKNIISYWFLHIKVVLGQSKKSLHCGPSCELQFASCKLEVAGCKLQVVSCKL